MSACCPKCKGTNGTQGERWELFVIVQMWGEGSEAVDSGRNTRTSLMTCLDCGARFNTTTVAKVRLQ